MSKATKVDRVVTYHEWLLPIEPHDPLLRGLSKPSYKLKNLIKSHDTLIRLSWKNTLKTKIITSTLPKSLWPLYLRGW